MLPESLLLIWLRDTLHDAEEVCIYISGAYSSKDATLTDKQTHIQGPIAARRSPRTSRRAWREVYVYQATKVCRASPLFAVSILENGHTHMAKNSNVPSCPFMSLLAEKDSTPSLTRTPRAERERDRGVQPTLVMFVSFNLGRTRPKSQHQISIPTELFPEVHSQASNSRHIPHSQISKHPPASGVSAQLTAQMPSPSI